MVILAYAFILISSIIFTSYGVPFLLRKWDEAQKKKAEKTTSQFEEMFIFLKKPALIALYILVPLGAASLIYIFTQKIHFSLIALIFGGFFPLFLVKFLDRKRRNLFVSQLIDGLMIMNSCLKGGLTLVQAFEMLAEDIQPPMSQEIALLNREIKIGVTLEEALLRLTERMPSEEMTLVSSAILVARETGGDLTKVFSRLIETIRERLKLKELVTTLTIQARLQAIVISLIGPVFFLVINRMNPGHFDIMWQTDTGRLLIFIAIFLQVFGVILIFIFGKVKI